MHLPIAISDILYSIRPVVPNAIVAGGCLRDVDHGVPWKDIDIFISTRNENFEMTLKEIGQGLGTPPSEVTWSPGQMLGDNEHFNVTDELTYREWNREILGVYEFSTNGGETVQIIGLDMPDFSMSTVVGRMDIGLCQIAWDGEEFHRSAQYLEDRQKKTMTCMLDLTVDKDHLPRTINRFLRWADRYPKHTFVIHQPTIDA